MKPELVLESRSFLAETPIWDSRKNILYWTDLFEGLVHEFDPVTGQDKFHSLGGMIGSAIPSDSGKLLCAMDDGLYLFDPESGSKTFLVAVEPGNPSNRLNDARCDAAGRVFASSVSKAYGTADYREDMLGSFYMVDKDLSVTRITAGINQYNGIAWSLDNKAMFVIDTHHMELMRYPYDLSVGVTGNATSAIRFPAEYGSPDGLLIDSEDKAWVFHWNGVITRWDLAAGTLLAVIPMPVPYVTCGGFGGDQMDELYITTSHYAMTPEQMSTEPLCHAGSMFRLMPGVIGRPDNFYKG